MLCQSCGKQIADTTKFCEFCGKPVTTTAAPPSTAPVPVAPVSPAKPPTLEPVPQAKTSGKAIASLILGIVSFFLPILIPAILAIVFGFLARSEINKSGGRLKGSGTALAGLIMGIFSVVVIPVILIIAAIAIPNLLRARTAANEATAVSSLRNINTAAVSYSNFCPNVGFLPSLAAIGPTPSPAERCPQGENLIDAMLASGTKSGYVFTYVPRDTDGNGTFDAYTLNADPVEPGRTGQRRFFTDQSGVIRSERDSPANEYSPPIN